MAMLSAGAILALPAYADDAPGVSVVRGGGAQGTMIKIPGGGAGPSEASDRRFVLYVGAPDCSVCRAWERSNRAAFVSGLQKNGIGFRTVLVTTLRDVRRESDWPLDLRWVRDANPQMHGTPWFFVTNGTAIEKVAFGTNRWQSIIAPIAG